MRDLFLALVACSFAVACSTKPAVNYQDAPALTGTQYSLTWGPVTVQPGVENTQCLVLRLANTDPIMVHQLHNTLSIGSHHMIIYKDDMDTAEITTPFNCQPFSGALNTSGMVAPLMITQKSDDELSLPDGVAYSLAANQMIRIELHYINTTDSPIDVTATANFYAADPATIHDAANILFIGSPDISLPPGQTTSLEAFFMPSRANFSMATAKIFAITGHEHHFGTNVHVGVSTGLGANNETPVYAPDPFVWSEPASVAHYPPFSVPDDHGFDFTCTWNNTSSQTVTFGESATDEMCFFWAYYYPSMGSHVCFHSNKYSVDICCPDAGALCNQVKL